MRLCLSDVIAEANALREIDIGTIATMPNDTLLRQHEGIRRASQLHLSIRDRYGPENGTHLWCTVHARFLWLQRTRRVAIPRSPGCFQGDAHCECTSRPLRSHEADRGNRPWAERSASIHGVFDQMEALRQLSGGNFECIRSRLACNRG